MSKKHYTDEFRRDAVALYRDTADATVVGIAADLGISHGSLTAWLKKAGVPIRKPRSHPVSEPTSEETPEQEAARLRAELAQVKAEKAKLETERDILRSAAKYFAGETRW
jgi:transposase